MIKEAFFNLLATTDFSYIHPPHTDPTFRIWGGDFKNINNSVTCTPPPITTLGFNNSGSVQSFHCHSPTGSSLSICRTAPRGNAVESANQCSHGCKATHFSDLPSDWPRQQRVNGKHVVTVLTWIGKVWKDLQNIRYISGTPDMFQKTSLFQTFYLPFPLFLSLPL